MHVFICIYYIAHSNVFCLSAIKLLFSGFPKFLRGPVFAPIFLEGHFASFSKILNFLTQKLILNIISPLKAKNRELLKKLDVLN